MNFKLEKMQCFSSSAFPSWQLKSFSKHFRGGKEGGCYEVWNSKGEIIEQVKGRWLFATRNSEGNICVIAEKLNKELHMVLL